MARRPRARSRPRPTSRGHKPVAGATTFAFRAMDTAGAATAGELEAASKAQVSEQLRQRGLIVLDVSEKSTPLKLEKLLTRWKGVDKRELAVFSRQFATLVASGMPMIRSLQTLEEQTQDDRIREAIGGVSERRRSRQHAREGDGAVPGSLRQVVPGDGPLRRAVGPPRGRARPRRLPGRESRRSPAPGQIGADVPGADLRLRGRGAAGRRRLRDPGLRQDLRRTGRRKSRGSFGACRSRHRSA